MSDNTKFPDRRSAPGTLAQQEINRLTVDAHMMASTLASTAESLTEAQARNVQLAAALEMVQGECGLLMGKVAKWEVWRAQDVAKFSADLDAHEVVIRRQSWEIDALKFDAPNIDAIALAAATNIAATCFAGVPGVKLTGRVMELVAEAMRDGGGFAAPSLPVASAGPSQGNYPLDRQIAAMPVPMFDMTKHVNVRYDNKTSVQPTGVAPAAPIDRDVQIRRLTLDSIEGAIAFGRMGVNPPPNEDHWLAQYWHIGTQLAELGETSAWDNVTRADDSAPLAVPLPADQGETAREKLYRAATGCSHTIDAEEIILRRDPRKPGNALAQLANRLDDAFARLSADPLPLPAGPSEQPTLTQAQAGEALLSKGDVLQIFADNAECSENGDNHGYAVIYERHCLKIAEAFRVYTPAAPSAKPTEAK